MHENCKQKSTELTSAALQDALRLLGEVSDYLKRLPHVPITRKLIDRIDAHVANPEVLAAERQAREHSAETELRCMTRVAGAYTAVGTPLVQVEVQGDRVRLSMGTSVYLDDQDRAEHVRWLGERVTSLLEAGVELKLVPMAKDWRTERMKTKAEKVLIRSAVWTRNRISEGEVNGRWVVEVKGTHEHPAGTLVCDPAEGEPDDLTFTAPNGKRYWDVPQGVRWTPRGEVQATSVREISDGQE